MLGRAVQCDGQRRLHIAAGIGAEREAAGTGTVEVQRRLGDISGGEGDAGQRRLAGTGGCTQSIGDLCAYRNAAEGDPSAAIAGRQPVAVQLEVQCLAALRRQLRLEVDLAGERHAGQPRPRRQIGQTHAEHAAGQQRGEIDIQIAIDAAAGPL